ncbi:MAG: PepSY domain-containing protein, partial [Pseudomonadota bacterium]
PWQLRQHADLWADILTYLSLVGVVSVFTGSIIGFIRLRVNHRYRGNAVTPYKGFNKWHHLLGLGSLLFVSTFMFSGLMSMLPWGIFDNETDVGEQIVRYNGGELSELDKFPALTTIANTDAVKEVEWQLTGGTPTLLLSRSATDKQVVVADGIADDATLRALIRAAVPALQPSATLLASKMISSYDNYYYSHHNRYRPLPALQVEFDDAESSWYHIDLNTGTVIQRMTHTDRVARWLYNGMHSLDFTLLFQHRPIWDATIILLCLFGFCFALTSVVIGWRRLVYRTKHPHVRVNS